MRREAPAEGRSRMTLWLFEHLVMIHIVVGAFGLVAF